MPTHQPVADAAQIAFCGLYCGACRSFLKGSCHGCQENTRASWCGIRSCCLENNYRSCAACSRFQDPRQCRKFNNFISKIFALVFRSDRAACIERIREIGYESFAAYMADHRLQSLRKN